MKKVYLIWLIFFPICVFGQEKEEKRDFFQWLTDGNIGLRKSYASSSRDEQKPASFYFNRDIENNSNFLTVDLGLKIKEWDVLENTSIGDKAALIFYPKLEYHRNTQEENEKNSLSGGVNMEFFPVPYKTPVTEGWSLSPWILGSVDFKNDKVSELQTMNYSSFLSLFSARPFLPGGKARSNNGNLVFRYFIYSGYEIYSATGEREGNSSYWANRVFMELWPFPAKNLEKEFVQLTFEFANRKALKDNLYEKGNINWLTAGLNIYPMGRSNVGLGLLYSKGGDPTNSFLETERLEMGLNLKF